MAKFRFKVMFNGHTDFITGKTYKKGDVIESDKEMDKIFENKFQRLPTKGQQEVLGPEEFLRQQQLDNNSIGLESNQERDENRTPTTELDGTEEFDDKGKNVETKKDEEKAETNKDEGGKDAGVKNVTEKFPAAARLDFKVTFNEDKKKYAILDTDTGNKVKGKGSDTLKSEEDVKHFLAEYGKKHTHTKKK